MWHVDCPYIVPSKAPKGWKENPTIHNKVNEALKDSKVEKRVKKSLENRAKVTSQTFSSIFDATKPRSPKALIANFYSAIAAKTTGIKNHLIRNGGANVHVCHAGSKHLYTKIKDSEVDEFLDTGIGKVKIDHWGVMETSFESPNGGFSPILLQNLAFAGSFITSLVLQSVLDSKGIHFDSKGPHLYKDGKIKYRLHRNGGHYTFITLGIPHPYPQDAPSIKPKPITSSVS